MCETENVPWLLKFVHGNTNANNDCTTKVNGNLCCQTPKQFNKHHKSSKCSEAILYVLCEKQTNHSD